MTIELKFDRLLREDRIEEKRILRGEIALILLMLGIFILIFVVFSK